MKQIEKSIWSKCCSKNGSRSSKSTCRSRFKSLHAAEF